MDEYKLVVTDRAEEEISFYQCFGYEIQSCQHLEEKAVLASPAKMMAALQAKGANAKSEAAVHRYSIVFRRDTHLSHKGELDALLAKYHAKQEELDSVAENARDKEKEAAIAKRQRKVMLLCFVIVGLFKLKGLRQMVNEYEREKKARIETETKRIQQEMGDILAEAKGLSGFDGAPGNAARAVSEGKSTSSFASISPAEGNVAKKEPAEAEPSGKAKGVAFWVKLGLTILSLAFTIVALVISLIFCFDYYNTDYSLAALVILAVSLLLGIVGLFVKKKNIPLGIALAFSVVSLSIWIYGEVEEGGEAFYSERALAILYCVFAGVSFLGWIAALCVNPKKKKAEDSPKAEK